MAQLAQTVAQPCIETPGNGREELGDGANGPFAGAVVHKAKGFRPHVFRGWRYVSSRPVAGKSPCQENISHMLVRDDIAFRNNFKR